MRAVITMCLAVFAAPAYAGDLDDCGQTRDVDVKLKGCSGVIADQAQSVNNRSFAYINRGIAYRIKGKVAQAIEDYSAAIALKPKHALAYVNRGNAYNAQNQMDEAITDYSRAIALHPRLADAFYNRANAWRRKGDKTRAIADYSQTVKIAPGYTRAYLNRAVVYRALCRYEEAMADYNVALGTGGKQPVAIYQSALKKAGHYSGEITGRYDKATNRALKAFVSAKKC